MVTILQQEPSPWEKFFGGLTQGYLKGSEERRLDKKQQQQSLAMGRMLYPGKSDEEILAIIGTALPEQVVKAAGEARKAQQQQQMISLLGMQPQQQGERSGTQMPSIQQEQMPPISDEEYPIPKGAPLPPKGRSAQEMGALALINPNIARAVGSVEGVEESRFSRQISAHDKISSKVIERSQEQLEKLPAKETALRNLRSSILSGDISGISKDFFAEKFNLPWLVTASGAQFRNASKEVYANDLAFLGGGIVRNQWIEKKIAEAYQALGRSDYANAIITEEQEMKARLERKHAELVNDISNSWRDKLGYVPAHLENEVNKRMKVFFDKEQKGLDKRLKMIAKAEKDKVPINQLPMYASVKVRRKDTGELYQLPEEIAKQVIANGQAEMIGD